MFVTRLGGYGGLAFPCGKAAVPIVTPHPPDVLAVGTVLHSFPIVTHPKSPVDLQVQTGFFRDGIPAKMARSRRCQQP
jgi:hypothetical protein